MLSYGTLREIFLFVFEQLSSVSGLAKIVVDNIN